MAMTNPEFSRYFEFQNESEAAEPLRWNLWTMADDFGVFGVNEGLAGNFPWNNARALFWNLLDNPLVLAFPAVEEPNSQNGLGIWQAALDLVAYGHGIPNVREVLNDWADGNLEVIDEPIWGFLRRNFGPSIWALIYYVNEYPYVVDWIREYLESFAIDVSLGEHPREQPFLSGNTFLRTRELLEFIDEENIRARFPATRLLLEGGGTDPAHLSHHFTDESIPDNTIRPELVQIGPAHFQAVVNGYPSWYKRLHEALAANMSASSHLEDPDFKVDVWIQAVGFLGQFKMGSYGLLFRSHKINDLGVPHRFGPQPLYMREGPELHVLHKPWESNNPNDFELSQIHRLGRLVVNVRNDINLAHSLQLEIGDSSWFRVRESWVKDGLPADAPQFKRCVIALTNADLLDLDETPVDQVLDDTSEIEIQDWAVETIISLWDDVETFPSIIAEIGCWAPEAPLDPSGLEDTMDPQGLMNLLKEFEKQCVSSDEQQHIMGLSYFFKNPPSSPRQLLDDLTTAFDYFGDPSQG